MDDNKNNDTESSAAQRTEKQVFKTSDEINTQCNDPTVCFVYRVAASLHKTETLSV